MTKPVDEAIWLTHAAHDRLRDELERLTRSTVAPAPEVEARIRELKSTLRRAEVGDKPDDGLVEPGMTITVVFDGDAEPTTFLLAQRGIADTDPAIGMDVYPPASPLGAAITGKYPGDSFRYEAPSGANVSGRIVGAEPFRNAPADSRVAG
jgi:transcription elongation factor GreA